MRKRRVNGRQLARALAAAEPVKKPVDAASFWADFSARLPLYPRPPAAVARRGGAALWWWASGGVGATLLGVAAILWPGAGAPVQTGVGIRSVEVAAPHEAVMIFQDGATKATILWVTGLPGPSGGVL